MLLITWLVDSSSKSRTVPNIPYSPTSLTLPPFTLGCLKPNKEPQIESIQMETEKIHIQFIFQLNYVVSFKLRLLFNE